MKKAVLLLCFIALKLYSMEEEPPAGIAIEIIAPDAVDETNDHGLRLCNDCLCECVNKINEPVKDCFEKICTKIDEHYKYVLIADMFVATGLTASIVILIFLST